MTRAFGERDLGRCCSDYRRRGETPWYARTRIANSLARRGVNTAECGSYREPPWQRQRQATPHGVGATRGRLTLRFGSEMTFVSDIGNSVDGPSSVYAYVVDQLAACGVTTAFGLMGEDTAALIADLTVRKLGTTPHDTRTWPLRWLTGMPGQQATLGSRS